jgi:hypothetical protein
MPTSSLRPITRIAAKARARTIQAEAKAAGRKLSYQQALDLVAAEQGYGNAHHMIAGYSDSAEAPVRILDRGGYDGRATIPARERPFIYTGALYAPILGPGRGKWCFDCTEAEADRVHAKVVAMIAKGKILASMRSTEVIAKKRDGFHLVLVFTADGRPETLKASLALFRECGATGELFFKSDLRTELERPGYDYSSLEVEATPVEQLAPVGAPAPGMVYSAPIDSAELGRTHFVFTTTASERAKRAAIAAGWTYENEQEPLLIFRPREDGDPIGKTYFSWEDCCDDEGLSY